MNTYPKYKPSGIDWLGDIPSHWDCVNIKNIASCNDSVLSESTDDTKIIDYVEISDVSYENGITGSSQILFKDAPSRARRITQNGDVIISTVRTYLKAIAQIGASNPIVSTGFAVIRPQRINSTFLFYAMSDNGFLNEVQRYSTGVSYPAITSQDLINLKFALPSKAEQEAIAGYLDEMTGKIDALMEERRAQVEDLRKYRTSLITETVTHGLNPDAPLRPSGIDWLGDIPKHWMLSKAKYYIEIKSGDALSKDEIFTDEQIPVYGGGEIIGYTNKYNTEKGDIIIGRVGARCGCVRIAEVDSWATDNALIVATNQNPYYLYRLFEAANLNRLNESNAQPLITATKVKDLNISLPPITEQQDIADYLDEKTAKIDALIEELESQLRDLATYRQAVITEAVTGKVDVRDWTPKN